MELLLQHGADPRLYADDGNTPEQVYLVFLPLRNSSSPPTFTVVLGVKLPS